MITSQDIKGFEHIPEFNVEYHALWDQIEFFDAQVERLRYLLILHTIRLTLMEQNSPLKRETMIEQLSHLYRSIAKKLNYVYNTDNAMNILKENEKLRHSLLKSFGKQKKMNNELIDWDAPIAVQQQFKANYTREFEEYLDLNVSKEYQFVYYGIRALVVIIENLRGIEQELEENSFGNVVLVYNWDAFKRYNIKFLSLFQHIRYNNHVPVQKLDYLNILHTKK